MAIRRYAPAIQRTAVVANKPATPLLLIRGPVRQTWYLCGKHLYGSNE